MSDQPWYGDQPLPSEEAGKTKVRKKPAVNKPPKQDENETPQTDTDGLRKARQASRHDREQIIKQLSNKQKGIPHLAELTEQIVTQFGGARMIAKEYLRVFNEAPEGSQVRSKMLDKIIDMVKINAQMFGSVDDLDDMTDDELSQLATLYLGQGDDEGD